MKDYDFVIVGQGLAGSLLGYYLLKAKKKVLILNDEALASSSRVAAGIFNPVTGKDLKKAWQVDNVFGFLEKSYSELEILFNKKFLYHTKIFRPFASIEQQNYFLSKTSGGKLNDYIFEPTNIEKYNKLIFNDLGGLEAHSAGWLDIPVLLDALREFFIEHDAYLPEKYDSAKLKITDETLSYQHYNIGKIIFSEGFYGSENPFFSWLPFNPVKGEILTANIDGFNLPEIINQGIFILPLGNNQCRIGSTYNWDTLDFETSIEARLFLEEKLKTLLKLPYTVTDQQAGVRPSTQDRRPFLGMHPIYKNVGIFNGLGTKGASLAPFFSTHFAEYLVNNKELMPEVNIKRHYSHYYSSNTVF